MSSLIKGPLDGAAAVRELTASVATRETAHAQQRADWDALQAKIAAALPTTADVENDGDRGPRPSRGPMAAIDQAADAQRAAHVGALLSAVVGLHVDEVRVLAAMARQLPGVRLRAACEAATAQGWVRSGATRVDVPSSPLARAQSSLLGTWREWIALVHGAQSTAARDVAQRDRGDVLADEAARRAGGGS